MDDTLDVLLGAKQFKPFQYPTFGQNSQIFFNENNQIIQNFDLKTQTTKQQTHETLQILYSNPLQIKETSQSTLHNCPKHLIKHIVQCLDYPISNIMQSPQFKSLNQSIKNNVKNLLSILEICSKGKTKSFSKQVLKLIFQQGSQSNQKIKLLQSTPIKKFVEYCDSQTIAQAKCILRQFTLRKLQQIKCKYVDHSHISRQTINQRYLLLFILQLESGKVSERVSKQDKEWILAKNF